MQGFRRQRDQRAAERSIFKSVFLAGIVSERPTVSLFIISYDPPLLERS